MSEVSARRLARSTLAVNLGRVWDIASHLVLTPVILAEIGLEGLGAWALVGSLVAYVTVFDSSFSTAYGKLTAELDRRGDHAVLREALGSGMALMGALGLAAAPLLWWLGPRLLPWLGVPPALEADARQALVFVTLTMVIRLSLGAGLRVLEGLQRLDLSVSVDAAGTLAEFSVTLALLRADYGLVALGAGALAGRVVTTALAWTLAGRLVPEIALSRLRPGWRGLRETFSLGARFQALSILNTLVGQALVMLLSLLCGVALLGAFQLGRRVLALATVPASSVIAPLLAAFANLEAGGETERWKTLLERASRLLACAAVVALAFVALFADAVLFAWTGQHVPEAAFAARVLALGAFFRLLTGVGTSALRASGTVRLEVQYGLIGGIGSLVGVAVGNALAGFAGVITGMALAQVLGALYFLKGFAVLRRLSLASYASSVGWPVIALLPALLLVGLASRFLPGLEPGADARWVALGSLAAAAAACAAACGPLVWWAVLSPEERRPLLRLLPLARR